MEPKPTANDSVVPPVVFFDGVCGLCNRFVNLVMRLDRNEKLRFAPLQGETAKETLPPLSDDASEWSIMYWDGEQVYSGTDANIAICRELGGMLSVFTILRIIPRGLREMMYRMVARTRYRLFGKMESCRVPSEGERVRFLP